MRSVKSALVVCLIVSILSICTACSHEDGNTIHYNVNTGDQIGVTVDDTEGYSLENGDNHINIVTKEGNVALVGMFIDKTTYEEYEELISSPTSAYTILDSASKDGLKYFLYTVDEEGAKGAYVCLLEGSHTGIYFTSEQTIEEMKKAFSMVTIALE